MKARVLLFFLCLALVPSTALWAQHASVYQRGAVLRIEAPGHTPGRIEGVVQGFTHEGLVIEERGTGTIYRVPPAGIRYLGHRHGVDRWYSAKKYGRASGFVLGSIGAISGPLVASGRRDDRMLTWSAAAAGAGAITGAVVGGGLGALFAREEWRVYYGPSLTRQAGSGHAVSVQVTIPTR
jgi:hypothetical protein